MLHSILPTDSEGVVVSDLAHNIVAHQLLGVGIFIALADEDG